MPLLLTVLYPEAQDKGFVCVRVARPQHQRQTTIAAAVAPSPWIGALALAAGKSFIVAEHAFLQTSHSSSRLQP